MNTLKTQECRYRGRILGEGPVTDIVVDRGRILSVETASKGRPGAGSARAVIAPPLFDIQVNGAGGIDLLDPKLTPEHIGEMIGVLARGGVGLCIPTIITAPPEAMEHACRVLAKALRDARISAAVPGIHLEGPHLNPEDGPRGAHPREHVRPPDFNLFRRLHKAAEGKLLYTTLAPEMPGAIDYIGKVRAMGVAVSLGHHNADAATIAAAVDAGATLCTHLGNGAMPVIPRHHNPLWPQLADDRLTASIIADGHHLTPAVLKTFVRAKTPRRIVLTSDCVGLLGMAPGHYEMFGAKVELREDGKVCLRGTNLLAGSSVPLLHDAAHAATVTDMTIAEAIASATTIPARLLGVRARFALPVAGARADFICFTPGAPPGLHAAYLRGERVGE
jgi:N-acetylglucosamine-6-phosphate deacetylase